VVRPARTCCRRSVAPPPPVFKRDVVAILKTNGTKHQQRHDQIQRQIWDHLPVASLQPLTAGRRPADVAPKGNDRASSPCVPPPGR